LKLTILRLVIGEAEQKKGKKKVRDGPKRPTTAFFFFSKDRRAELKQEKPDLKFGDLARIMAQEWNGASTSVKAPYEKKAAADKKRYLDEKAAGVGREGATKKTKKGEPAKKGKKEKKPGPKRALSAFMYFSQDKRAVLRKDSPELSFGELGAEVGKLWKKVSKTDLEKYEAMAKKDKARFEKEKAAFEKAQPAKEEEESSEEASGSEEER